MKRIHHNKETIGLRGLVALGASALIALSLGVWGLNNHSLSLQSSMTDPQPQARVAGAQGDSRPGARPQPKAKSTPATPQSAKADRLGPLLASTPYARAAYQLYPGSLNDRTRRALAGFTISFKRQKQQVTLSISVMGSSRPPYQRSFAASGKVYFIEARFGDDSGYTGEDNFGDDGLIITNAAGRILLPPRRG